MKVDKLVVITDVELFVAELLKHCQYIVQEGSISLVHAQFLLGHAGREQRSIAESVHQREHLLNELPLVVLDSLLLVRVPLPLCIGSNRKRGKVDSYVR